MDDNTGWFAAGMTFMVLLNVIFILGLAVGYAMWG